MLIAATGDLYIPDRAIDIPEKFRKLLSPNPASKPSNSKLSKVLCLGNVTSSWSTLQFLHNLSPSFHLVKGEFDDENVLSQQLLRLSDDVESSILQKHHSLPQCQVVSHDNLKIGFTNGYQVVPRNDPVSLLVLARELDADILIWGGTHKVEAYTLDGKFFINPGSLTGAFSFDWPEVEEQESEDEANETKEKKEKKETKETKEDKKELTDDKEEKDEKKELKDEKPESDETKEDQESGTDANVLAEELSSSVPSFCLLDVRESSCTVYIYTYLNDEVKVDKVSYHKE